MQYTDDTYQSQVDSLFAPYSNSADETEYRVDPLRPSECGCVDAQEPVLSIHRSVLFCPQCHRVFFDPQDGWLKEWQEEGR